MKKKKQINMTEEDYQELVDRKDKYREKYLFWKPLGIVGVTMFIVLCIYALANLLSLIYSPEYTITKTQCHNETTNVYPVETTCMYGKDNVECPTRIISVCNKKEVNDIVSVNEICVSHSPSREYALLNCFSVVTNNELNAGWLYNNCICEEYNCLGKECKKGECYIYKCGEFEVTVKNG